MPYITITPEVALRYPEKIKQLDAALARSKAKGIENAKDNEFEYGFHYSEHVLVDGLWEKRRRMTAEERVADRLPSITASLHRTWWGGKRKTRWCSDAFTEVPAELQEILLWQVKKDIQEEKRIAAMTPEERAEELEELVKLLQGTPGFLILGASSGV